MLESVVDAHNNSNLASLKMETPRKSAKITLDDLYQQKKKIEIEQKQLENTEESNNY